MVGVSQQGIISEPTFEVPTETDTGVDSDGFSPLMEIDVGFIARIDNGVRQSECVCGSKGFRLGNRDGSHFLLLSFLRLGISVRYIIPGGDTYEDRSIQY